MTLATPPMPGPTELDTLRLDAFTLYMQGDGPTEIGRRLRISITTATRWVKDWEGNHNSRSAWLRRKVESLGARGIMLLARLLEHVEAEADADPSFLPRYLVGANIIAGTSIDKWLKSRDVETKERRGANDDAVMRLLRAAIDARMLRQRELLGLSAPETTPPGPGYVDGDFRHVDPGASEDSVVGHDENIYANDTGYTGDTEDIAHMFSEPPSVLDDDELARVFENGNQGGVSGGTRNTYLAPSHQNEKRG